MQWLAGLKQLKWDWGQLEYRVLQQKGKAKAFCGHFWTNYNLTTITEIKH